MSRGLHSSPRCDKGEWGSIVQLRSAVAPQSRANNDERLFNLASSHQPGCTGGGGALHHLLETTNAVDVSAGARRQAESSGVRPAGIPKQLPVICEFHVGGLRWDKWSCSAQCGAAEGGRALDFKGTHAHTHTVQREIVNHQLCSVPKL